MFLRSHAKKLAENPSISTTTTDVVEKLKRQSKNKRKKNQKKEVERMPQSKEISGDEKDEASKGSKEIDEKGENENTSDSPKEKMVKESDLPKEKMEKVSDSPKDTVEKEKDVEESNKKDDDDDIIFVAEYPKAIQSKGDLKIIAKDRNKLEKEKSPLKNLAISDMVKNSKTTTIGTSPFTTKFSYDSKPTKVTVMKTNFDPNKNGVANITEGCRNVQISVSRPYSPSDSPYSSSNSSFEPPSDVVSVSRSSPNGSQNGRDLISYKGLLVTLTQGGGRNVLSGTAEESVNNLASKTDSSKIELKTDVQKNEKNVNNILDLMPSRPFFSSTPDAVLYFGNEQRIGLRPVIIDGSNVAVQFGKNRVFSSRGILLCARYFIERGHRVTAFVPQFRDGDNQSSRSRNNRIPTVDSHLLTWMCENDLLTYTPHRRFGSRAITCYDDNFIVEYAHQTGGVIVSKDHYRDILQKYPEWSGTINNRVLMFTWVGETFMVPRDPLGRYGPSLEHFLRFAPNEPGLKKASSLTVDESMKMLRRIDEVLAIKQKSSVAVTVTFGDSSKNGSQTGSASGVVQQSCFSKRPTTQQSSVQSNANVGELGCKNNLPMGPPFQCKESGLLPPPVHGWPPLQPLTAYNTCGGNRYRPY